MEQIVNILSHPGIAIIIPFLLSYLCAHHARKKGKDFWLWFGIGLLGGIFAYLFLLYLTEIREPKLKKKSVVQTIEPLFAPQKPQKLWYFLDEKHEQCGPISTDALFREMLGGKINDRTYVWEEEMTDWKRIQEIPELKQTTQEGARK